MTTQEQTITRVVKAIEAIKSGGMVIMVDDEDRENEGDLVFAADHVCPEKINFMTKEARGLICLSLDQAIIDRLKLPMMEDTTKLTSSKTTAFTVSIEAREGVTTGISAADRAHTIKVAVHPDTTPDDIVVPGHIFPLKARNGGVLQRAGHTEGSVDLVRMAGFSPSAVICEIMNDDGTMARMPDLEAFAQKHDIPIVTIADLVHFRLFRESHIDVLASHAVNTAFGDFRGLLFRSKIDDLVHFALINEGDFENDVVDVRVHRQRTLVDVFSNPETGGRFRIEHGLKMLQESKAGVFLYLMVPDSQQDHLDEFASLANFEREDKKKKAAPPWVEKDQRMLGVGAQILRHLGVRKMRVHMSNPTPLKGLHGFELEVVDTIEMKPNE
jgi:3,4-dihydroxy 2-butanone 4-phosphate synthase/GTP cyclohydrolase II